jgi:hypothetical protein
MSVINLSTGRRQGVEKQQAAFGDSLFGENLFLSFYQFL